MPYNRKAFLDDYATETFYFPLSVQGEDEDSEDLYNVTSGSVRWFENDLPQFRLNAPRRVAVSEETNLSVTNLAHL